MKNKNIYFKIICIYREINYSLYKKNLTSPMPLSVNKMCTQVHKHPVEAHLGQTIWRPSNMFK